MCSQVYSEEEMRKIEASADEVDTAARAGELPAMCFHNSQSRNGHLKRTKFFFGARCTSLSPQIEALLPDEVLIPKYLAQSTLYCCVAVYIDTLECGFCLED